MSADDLERRAREWNNRDRAVLDRETWLLLIASGARAVGLDLAEADPKAVAARLRERPEVVADALRLIDLAEERRRARERAERERLAEQWRRDFALGLRLVIADLRGGFPVRVWVRGVGMQPFLEVVRGAGTTQGLARYALGGKLRRPAVRLRAVDLAADRMCETRHPGAAAAAAAIWLRLRGLWPKDAAEAADMLEAERARRAA